MRNVLNITLSIDVHRIADLLCSALEGGSNYWYMIEDKIEPKAWTIDERPVYATREEAEANINTHYLHYYPLNEGGALLITDERADEPTLKEPVRLDLERIQQGLEAWADDAASGGTKHGAESATPRHLADFLADNADGDTADVFLQYCIFGKVIYG